MIVGKFINTNCELLLIYHSLNDRVQLAIRACQSLFQLITHMNIICILYILYALLQHIHEADIGTGQLNG